MNALVRLYFHPVMPLNWQPQPTYTSLHFLRSTHPHPHYTSNYLGTITARYSGISHAIVIEVLARHLAHPGAEVLTHSTTRVATGPIPTVTFDLFVTYRTYVSLLLPHADDLDNEDIQLIGQIPVPLLPGDHPFQEYLNTQAAAHFAAH